MYRNSCQPGPLSDILVLYFLKTKKKLQKLWKSNVLLRCETVELAVTDNCGNRTHITHQQLIFTKSLNPLCHSTRGSLGFSFEWEVTYEEYS